MDTESQDPVATIEQALIALRRPHRGHRGVPPWMQGGHDQHTGPDHQGGDQHAGHDRRSGFDHHGAPGDLEHMPRVRGPRGPLDRLGGAARFRLLSVLRERNGLSVSEIAERIGVDQPRASRLVNESAERGLVTRRADERDARRSVVELTAAGRTILETANASRRSAVTDAVADFTDEERVVFADLLSRFVASWRP